MTPPFAIAGGAYLILLTLILAFNHNAHKKR